MYGTVKYAEYQNLDAEIKRTMKRSAREVVLLGYLLRRMMDEMLWTECYDSLDDYLGKELHMDYTRASRFIGVNKKYSLDGGMEIDEKWANYSQSVLIEMLNMPPELMEKVTPDMTARQVRKVKRQDAQKKAKERAKSEPVAEDIPSPTSSVVQEVQKEPVPEGKTCDEIPDAQYRELDASEKVATSQPERSCRDGVTDMPAGDNTDKSEAVQDNGITDELTEVKRILKKEQKVLDDYLMVDGLPEKLMFKQKTIVAALAAMICDLENAEYEPEPVKQPELPVFKNNNQRKEWLRSYRDWGLWYRDDNIGVEYYKYDFDNGAKLIVEVYMNEDTEFYGAYGTCYLHLVGGPKPQKGKYGVGKWTWHEKYSKYPNSETELVEFLKEVQRNG